MAFLNAKKNFEDGQASCKSLGDGWHAPLSNNQEADTRAFDNTSVAEAVGVYVEGVAKQKFWASSYVIHLHLNVCYVSFVDNPSEPSWTYADRNNIVVCVKS